MENPDDGTERHHMKNPDDGTDAFHNERTSRSFRKEKWPLVMVLHAHCEMKNGPNLRSPKRSKNFCWLEC
jgi:hypothetical protein